MRRSLYWDDFERRADETVACLKAGEPVPVRRVAIFITDACNLRCAYCNVHQKPRTMSSHVFKSIVEKYPDAIIHITGGEPSVVGWLYPFIVENGWKYRFHLNTNAYIQPPARHIQRLKVSLDSYCGGYWDNLVGVGGAFARVVDNIKRASVQTVTSITFTLTADNYTQAPSFVEFANREFPHLYAVFFSIYKGTDERFVFDSDQVEEVFDTVVPELLKRLKPESAALLQETMNERRRLLSGIRFPGNNLNNPCYLSMSERVYGPDGVASNCSHLYRDGIIGTGSAKCRKCLYGCNQRLVDFNKIVEDRLTT